MQCVLEVQMYCDLCQWHMQLRCCSILTVCGRVLWWQEVGKCGSNRIVDSIAEQRFDLINLLFDEVELFQFWLEAPELQCIQVFDNQAG